MAALAPFPRDLELDTELIYTPSSDQKDGCGTITSERGDTHLPGFPRYALPGEEAIAVMAHDLRTPDLNSFARWLWIMTTPSSSHISSLTTHRVKGRQIVITENPELHCTWLPDRVFLKPLPAYLWSWTIWAYLDDIRKQHEDVQEVESIRAAARGFLRSYLYLVRHPSDFKVAQQHDLLPTNMEYADFDRFLSAITTIEDHEVSPRWQYGELRLSRLNFWAKFFLFKFAFQKVHNHYAYSLYLARFVAPILLIYAFFGVVLNAMQVGLSVKGSGYDGEDTTWGSYANACRWFSVVAICLSVALMVGLVLHVILLVIREVLFTVLYLLLNRIELRRAQRQAKSKI